MTVLLATTFALALWVVAWGIGIKGFDGLMGVILIVLLATAWTFLRPYLPGNRDNPDDPGAGGNWNAR
jgi:hypothetical protein